MRDDLRRTRRSRWRRLPRSWADAAALVVALTSLVLAQGCAKGRSAARQAEIQREIRYWEEHRVTRASGARRSERATPTRPYTEPPQLGTQPRVLCIDGTLSLSCIAGGSYERCCDYQGGVYYDPWGNVVLSR